MRILASGAARARRGTGRRRLRFAGMFRRSPYAVVSFGLAFVVAAIVGVQLGESVIAGINPVHFQGAAVHPRDRGAAVDPATIPPARQASYYEAYGWDAGNEARRRECADCGYPATQSYAWVESAPATRLAGENWRDPTPVTEPEPWQPGEVSAQPDRNVLRYADYPIEEKPAVAAAEVETPAQPDKIYEE